MKIISVLRSYRNKITIGKIGKCPNLSVFDNIVFYFFVVIQIDLKYLPNIRTSIY